MQTPSTYVPIDWVEYERKRKEDDAKYAEIKKMLQETQESSRQTMENLDRTMLNLQESIKGAQETQDKIDNFKKQFGEALNGLAERIGQSMGPQFKKREGYEGPLARESSVAEVVKQMASVKNIVFLTGAGLSAASGIPTFRGKGGFWTSGEDTYAAQQVLTYDFFTKTPKLCWKWHRDFQQILRGKTPNASHKAIADLHLFLKSHPQSGKKFTLVTQNIDALHAQCYPPEFKSMGYHQDIYEIHGNIKYMRCDQHCYGSECELAVLEPMPELDADDSPLCSACKGPARPHILFFDESYDQQQYQRDTVTKLTEECDCLVVVGTKLETGLSASIVSKAVARNALVIEINPESEIEIGNTLQLRCFAENAVPQLCKQLVMNQTPKMNTQTPPKQLVTNPKPIPKPNTQTPPIVHSKPNTQTPPKQNQSRPSPRNQQSTSTPKRKPSIPKLK